MTQTALQSQISALRNRICRVVVPAVAGSSPVDHFKKGLQQ